MHALREPAAALGFTLPCEPERACMSPDGPATWPGGGTEMGRAIGAAERESRARAALVAGELAALGRMTSAELTAKYEELLGRPSRTRNAQYLRKRLAWRIQELAEGGLSVRALARIEELGPQALASWRRPARGGTVPQPPTFAMPRTRDPRLPAVGTVLTRVHGKTEHRVTVLEDGFEYQGERYRSLSKIASVITCTPWNGFLFFFGRSHGTKGRTS